MRKALYILSLLNDSDIQWLVSNGTRKDLIPGSSLIEAGQPVSALYIVLDGEISVSLPNGKVVTHLGVGEIVGEISYLDSRPPLTSVAATEEASVFEISRDELSSKLQRDDGFASRFYHAIGTFLAVRLRENTASLGYADGQVSSEELEAMDELPEELMEQVSLAGTRFNWILSKLQES